MIQKLSICALAMALLFFANVAVAVLIGVNDPSIVGNGNPSQDGFNLTRDTETDLDWLDLTLSTTETYNDVSTQFGTGSEFEGFRFATESELQTLYDHASLPELLFQGPDPTQPILDFMSLVGNEPSASGVGYVATGQFDNQNGEPDTGFALVADHPVQASGIEALVNIRAFGGLNNPDFSAAWMGHWLVRPIPEPSSLILCCIGGGLVLGYVRRRRDRQST